MASPEAVECLRQGGDAWKEFVGRPRTGLIDLRFADLEGCDLRERDFVHCDLSGAQMAGANLDHTSFVNTVVTGAQFINASLVRSTWRDVKAARVSITHAIVRSSDFIGVEFTTLEAASVVIVDTRFQRCQLTDVSVQDSEFKDVTFDETKIRRLQGAETQLVHCMHINQCDLVDWSFDSSLLAECSFNGCRISQWTMMDTNVSDATFKLCDLAHVNLVQGRFSDCEISQSQILDMSFNSTQVVGLDLSGSTVKQGNLTNYDLATCVLLHTAFVACEWPTQAGRVTWTGAYIPSPYLLRQPVQDVYGVSPTLRREIGDAQYLMKTSEQLHGLGERLLFRFWGATTEFGQSLVRLTCFSVFLVLVHTIALLASSGATVQWNWSVTSQLIKEVGVVGQSFLGFGQVPTSSGRPLASAIQLSDRIAGFLCLGLWISIASTRISRLSSY